MKPLSKLAVQGRSSLRVWLHTNTGRAQYRRNVQLGLANALARVEALRTQLAALPASLPPDVADCVSWWRQRASSGLSMEASAVLADGYDVDAWARATSELVEMGILVAGETYEWREDKAREILGE